MTLKQIFTKPKRVIDLYKSSKNNCWVNPGHFYSPLVNVEEYKKTNKTSWSKNEQKLNDIDLNIDSQLKLSLIHI